MNQRHLLLVAAGFFFTTLLASAASRSQAQGVLYDFPLTFEENRGQADSRFDYLARGPGYGLYLSAGEILFGLRHGSNREAPAQVLRMQLAGGLPAPSIQEFPSGVLLADLDLMVTDSPDPVLAGNNITYPTFTI